jgi:hypothetical protein
LDCEQYRKLYKKFSKFPLPRKVWDTPEYEKYINHFNSCEECGEWYLMAEAKRKGAKIQNHPCVHMAYYSSQEPKAGIDPQDDPDVPVLYYKKAKCYGIPVRDGGSSFLRIANCPWCGTSLEAKPKRNRAKRKV